MLNKKSVLLGSLFIVIIAISRFLPHPNNFTPVGALAVFGGVMYRKKHFFIILTVLALFLSDFFLNNIVLRASFDSQEGIIWFSNYMIWVYGAFTILFFISGNLLKKFSYQKLLATSLIGALLFYLITNFGSWMFFDLYTKDLSGLLSCYIAGIPFFKFTLLGDVIYAFMIFGVYDLITRYYTVPNLVMNG